MRRDVPLDDKTYDSALGLARSMAWLAYWIRKASGLPLWMRGSY